VLGREKDSGSGAKRKKSSLFWSRPRFECGVNISEPDRTHNLISFPCRRKLQKKKTGTVEERKNCQDDGGREFWTTSGAQKEKIKRAPTVGIEGFSVSFTECQESKKGGGAPKVHYDLGS